MTLYYSLHAATNSELNMPTLSYVKTVCIMRKEYSSTYESIVSRYKENGWIVVCQTQNMNSFEDYTVLVQEVHNAT